MRSPSVSFTVRVITVNTVHRTRTKKYQMRFLTLPCTGPVETLNRSNSQSGRFLINRIVVERAGEMPFGYQKSIYVHGARNKDNVLRTKSVNESAPVEK